MLLARAVDLFRAGSGYDRFREEVIKFVAALE